MQDVKNDSLRVLGIDPGTTIIGWAVLGKKNDTITPVAYGHIDTKDCAGESKKILALSQKLQKVIDKYHPSEAAVEKVFFFKNQKTVINVSQARGAILLILEQNNVPVFEYTPLQIKQAMTGYGRADKTQVQLMARNILRLPEIPKPDDTADALAAAVCHMHSRKILNSKLY